MASIISAGTTSGTSLNLSGDTSGVLQLQTNGTTPAITIDTAQNVGIGTASPFGTTTNRTVLSVNGTTDSMVNLGVNGTRTANFYAGSTITVIGSHTSIPLSFETGNTERMRISSGGSLLFGTTDSIANITSSSGTGLALYNSSGNTQFLGSNANDNVIQANRQGTDGVIIALRKSGTSVGNIEVTATGVTYTGTNGITFTATQTASAGANTLDDYEEGTWLPTIEPSSGAFGSVTYNAARNGYYTKIGRVVHIVALVYVTSYTVGTASNQMKISNLPFTAANLTQNFAVGNIGQYGGNGYTPSVAGANVFFRIEQNTTYGLVCLDTNTTFTDEAIGAFSTGGFLFRITATYITST